jgi:hypothetical protein
VYNVSVRTVNRALEMQGLDETSLNNIISMYKKEFLSGDYQNILWGSIDEKRLGKITY